MMRKLSIILVVALLASVLSFTAVFAQPAAPAAVHASVTPAVVCYGALNGQVKDGKLYVFPGFNLTRWLRHNPRVTFAALQKLNPRLVNGIQQNCDAIILPSM